MTIRLATISNLDLLVPLFDAYRVFYRKRTDPAGFTQLFPTHSSPAAAPVLILNDQTGLARLTLLLRSPTARRGPFTKATGG